MVRCRKTRISLDLEDYSKTGSIKKFIESLSAGLQPLCFQWKNFLEGENTESDGNISDDGFGVLSAHRSFVADALTVEEEESPNDSTIMEWAEQEAKQLGLLDSKK
jgi:adenosine deaminase